MNRNHPADRNREEERDHDGRLRDPGRARTASVARAIDPPSLSATLSSHPDDDNGGPLGALPLMLGHGTGSELRQPLGYTMVGRTRSQPAFDLVHDAGGLTSTLIASNVRPELRSVGARTASQPAE